MAAPVEMERKINSDDFEFSHSQLEELLIDIVQKKYPEIRDKYWSVSFDVCDYG